MFGVISPVYFFSLLSNQGKETNSDRTSLVDDEACAVFLLKNSCGCSIGGGIDLHEGANHLQS